MNNSILVHPFPADTSFSISKRGGCQMLPKEIEKIMVMDHLIDKQLTATLIFWGEHEAQIQQATSLELAKLL
jgi:hypothetical protein